MIIISNLYTAGDYDEGNEGRFDFTSSTNEGSSHVVQRKEENGPANCREAAGSATGNFVSASEKTA